MRAVLRQISDKENPSKDKEVEKKDTPIDLKGALASVLSGVTGEEKVKEENDNSPKPLTSPDEPIDNSLDPKKLERMMRIKTDDKTPLK